MTARDLGTGRLLWRRDLPGVVITTPAWVGDAIVVTEAADPLSGNTFTGVAALDAATGAVRWERGFDGAGVSSPTVVGASVLVGYTAGVARLRLSDGGVVWRRRLPAGNVSSPASDGKRAYVGHSDGSAFVAMSLRTGRSLWQITGGGRGVGADVFPPTWFGKIVYVPLWGNGVLALDAASGAELWRVGAGSTFWWGLSTDGRRLIGSADDVHVLAVDRRTGERLWARDLHGIARAATLAGGVALIADQSAVGRNQVDLLDAATGDPLGAVTLPDVGEDLTYSPMPVAVSGGRVAVANWDTLVVLTLPTR